MQRKLVKVGFVVGTVFLCVYEGFVFWGAAGLLIGVVVGLLASLAIWTFAPWPE